MMTFDAKKFLANVPHLPGVYRMYDDSNTVIYVGKAKDLKKRLSSYFRKQLNSKKTEALVASIHHIETTITTSETEALLLEHNYIKTYQPRYNVLLRDDKSYPYILLTKETHPRITSYRGSKKIQGEYFGPYPNAGAVRETLSLLQKLFPIRQCENSVYNNRSRPCLQYQNRALSCPLRERLCNRRSLCATGKFCPLVLTGERSTSVGSFGQTNGTGKSATEF